MRMTRAQAMGGTLRPIAITADKRNLLVPDWSPLAEVLPGINITAWEVDQGSRHRAGVT